MIMINTNIEFDEFIIRLKDKFGFRRKTRCKIQDEDGDGMISVSDQEDLDMAISTSKKNARRDRSEFGKLEVSLANPISASHVILRIYLLTCSVLSDLGPRGRLNDPGGIGVSVSSSPKLFRVSFAFNPHQSSFGERYRSGSALQDLFPFSLF